MARACMHVNKKHICTVADDAVFAVFALIQHVALGRAIDTPIFRRNTPGHYHAARGKMWNDIAPQLGHLTRHTFAT